MIYIVIGVKIKTNMETKEYKERRKFDEINKQVLNEIQQYQPKTTEKVNSLEQAFEEIRKKFEQPYKEENDKKNI